MTFAALLIAFLVAATGFLGASALEFVVRDGGLAVAIGFFVLGVALFAKGTTSVLTMAGWRGPDPLGLVDAALAVLIG